MITIELPQDIIDEIFEEAESQTDYTVGLYRAVVPEWEKIANMNHVPVVSEATSEYLFKKAIEFDQEKHPHVVNGGQWMNVGFGVELGSECLVDED